MHGGFGLGFERHVGFAEIFVALFMIAGFTGDRDVIPGVGATFGTGNDVIDRQCSGATAILAPMSVAPEQFAPTYTRHLPQPFGSGGLEPDMVLVGDRIEMERHFEAKGP